MQISVMGCGWLGQPLAIKLKHCGYNIVATTRSLQKYKALNKLGLHTVQFTLGDQVTEENSRILFTSEVLILNIPVGRKTTPNGAFLNHIEQLLQYAVRNNVQKVIFISTTSVYGNSCGVVTEQSPTLPVTTSAQINLNIEKLVCNYFPQNTTIIRLAGLVGKNRHPVNFLAGKTNLPRPNDKVNLIHQEDVISAITVVLQKALWGHTLHLSALTHPTRAQYYTWAAKAFALPPPVFVGDNEDVLGKEINSEYSLQLLELSLKYASPFEMVG